MKQKHGWVVVFDNYSPLEYFNGTTLSQDLNKAYVFDNFNVAITVCNWWNYQSQNGKYYCEKIVVKHSQKISKVTS